MLRASSSCLCLALALALPACTGGDQGAAPQGPPAADPAVSAPAQEARQAAMNALRRGLEFLAKQQNENGSWGAFPGMPEPGHVGMTGLVVYAMAQAPAELRDAYAPGVMRAATAWLAMQQQEDGSIWIPAMGQATYNTAIAAMALAAADPYDPNDHAPRLDAARAYLAKGQFGPDTNTSTDNRNYGGWGYGDQGEPDADLSNAQFAVEALNRLGLPPDSPVWERARTFISRCQNRSESNDSTTFHVLDDGGFIYDPGHDTNKSTAYEVQGKQAFPSYASMTYAGLKSLLHAQVTRDDGRVRAAVEWIRANYTLEENFGLGTRERPEDGKQGLFYYYYTFAKALEAWGEPELTDARGVRHRWAAELSEALSAHQREDGSWRNDNKRWWEDDPVLVTSYAANALSVCARNLEK